MSLRSVLLARRPLSLVKSQCFGAAIKRQSHVVSYRSPPPPHSKATRIGAVVAGGAMWWWVIWHLWHEPDHITGEFDYPDPAKWTNAELGIPKDS